MSYERFAYLYDELMEDVPYDQWVEFVISRLNKAGLEGKSFLDLACGTGELSVRFAQKGYKVTGVDLSTDMLAVARAKAEDKGLSIPFFEQDMAELEGLDSFDVIGIFCDSLNYLEAKEQVENTFAKAFEHLNDGGILIFDVHSIYKMNELFINETYTFNEDHLAYIWNCFPGDDPNSVEHELSFFVLDEPSGMYNRFDELHFQRTFPVEMYSEWLEEAGFSLLEVTADFKNQKPEEDSERIFFMAQKRKKSQKDHSSSKNS